jgi:hypothetical protein
VTGLARSAQFFAETEDGHDRILAEVGSHEERPDV